MIASPPTHMIAPAQCTSCSGVGDPGGRCVVSPWIGVLALPRISPVNVSTGMISASSMNRTG